MKRNRIAIVGSAGIPATYGGFETLAENLVRFHAEYRLADELTVYCSSRATSTRPAQFLATRLRYIPLAPNGIQSIFYDIWSLVSALQKGADNVLILGVSGALFLPVLRVFSNARFTTNIDGIERRRQKWGALARSFLRLSERAALRWSHTIIADNQGIADYVQNTYGRTAQLIAYGGDQALGSASAAQMPFPIPTDYALSLCRIEPENNVAMILAAFAQMPEQRLVFVGNWQASQYGRDLWKNYGSFTNIHLLDAIYDPHLLRRLRDDAWIYVHGHSAGGTNPSMVEMMHFAIPIVAYDCTFNRFTTEEKAAYFRNSADLCAYIQEMTAVQKLAIGTAMVEIARRRYAWHDVALAYFSLLGSTGKPPLGDPLQ